MKTLLFTFVLFLTLTLAAVYAVPCSPEWQLEHEYTCVKIHPNYGVAYDQAWECAYDHCNPPGNCYCVYEEYSEQVWCGSLMCTKYTVVVYYCCYYGM